MKGPYGCHAVRAFFDCGLVDRHDWNQIALPPFFRQMAQDRSIDAEITELRAAASGSIREDIEITAEVGCSPVYLTQEGKPLIAAPLYLFVVAPDLSENRFALFGPML